jgi:hypothetical protein
MLSVYFHNTGTTPTNETGDYDIYVKVNGDQIYTGHIEDVPRGDWRDLIIALACELQLDQRKECKE